jgi:hypothetical protein
MKLTLKRFNSQREFTQGILYVDGKFECFTLEDEYRTHKIWGETRIPDGTYEIKLRKEGGHHRRYAARFGTKWHKGMLHLQDVPNFKWILIHIGNDDDDTAGCLLVGKGIPNADNGFISSSTNAYKDLYPQVRDALVRNEEVHITIETIN